MTYSKQDYIDLFQQSYQQMSSSVVFGRRPTKMQKQANFLIPHQVYESKITLQKNLDTVKQKKWEHLQDNRIRITDTTQYPFCCIGLLSMKFGKQWAFGTGSLISGTKILTCAHNCINQKKPAQQIWFYPGSNGGSGKGYKVKKPFSLIKEYVDAQDDDQQVKHDYAVLQIEKDLSDRHGYFGMDFTFKTKEFKNRVVTICGYPGDKEENQNKTMWKDSGLIKDTRQNIMYYDIITEIGNSGSPIFIQNGDDYFIVGVHTHSVRYKGINGGGFIQMDMMEKVHSQIVKKTGKLQLYCNNIGTEGVRRLMKTSKDWPKLSELNLGSNKIDNEGIKHLVKAAGNWPNLLKLDLRYNEIGPDGMKTLISISKYCPNLSVINLNSNQISDKGVKYVIEMGNKLPKLQKLSLQNNNIGEDGKKLIKASIKISYLFV